MADDVEQVMADDEEQVMCYLRHATPTDAPLILALIRQLADFELLTHMCVATEDDLAHSLFKQPPFQGPTVILLEISTLLPPPPSFTVNATAHAPHSSQIPHPQNDASFIEIEREWTLKGFEGDEEACLFKSVSASNRIVVGFVLFFPNFSTFLCKPGIYVEDLYIRKPYRRQGFGKLLLETVAEGAANRNAGRVEWSVLDWNVNAIKFYEALGATLLHDWRICRLTGDALQKYKKSA